MCRVNRYYSEMIIHYMSYDLIEKEIDFKPSWCKDQEVEMEMNPAVRRSSGPASQCSYSETFCKSEIATDRSSLLLEWSLIAAKAIISAPDASEF